MKKILIVLAILISSCSKDQEVIPELPFGWVRINANVVQSDFCSGIFSEESNYLFELVFNEAETVTYESKGTYIEMPPGKYRISKLDVFDNGGNLIYERPSSEGTHIFYVRDNSLTTLSLKIQCK